MNLSLRVRMCASYQDRSLLLECPNFVVKYTTMGTIISSLIDPNKWRNVIGQGKAKGSREFDAQSKNRFWMCKVVGVSMPSAREPSTIPDIVASGLRFNGGPE